MRRLLVAFAISMAINTTIVTTGILQDTGRISSPLWIALVDMANVPSQRITQWFAPGHTILAAVTALTSSIVFYTLLFWIPFILIPSDKRTSCEHDEHSG
jgi:hypothetical protein